MTALTSSLSLSLSLSLSPAVMCTPGWIIVSSDSLTHIKRLKENKIMLTRYQNKSPVPNHEPFFVLASQHQLTHSLHHDDSHERLLPPDPSLSWRRYSLHCKRQIVVQISNLWTKDKHIFILKVKRKPDQWAWYWGDVPCLWARVLQPVQLDHWAQ